MKKGRQHSIDKLFHDVLDGQRIEPSAGVWESLKAFIPSRGGSGALFFLLSFLALGTFSLLLIGNIADRPDAMTSTGDQVSTVTAKSTEAAMPAGQDAISGQEMNTEAEETTGVISAPGNMPSTNISASTVLSENINEKKPAMAGSDVSLSGQAGQPRYMLPHTAAFSGSIITHPLKSSPDLRVRKPGQPRFRLNLKDDYARKADIVFGAGFSPAVNIYPEGQNRNDYTFELVTAMEKSRFIVETGIAANYASESARYRINYTSYDSVGFYIGVTSFSIIPGDPDSLVYETSLKSIYDSIDRYRIAENTNKFVYLQFPLKIGYRIFEGRRFSVDLKTGVIFSLQLYRDIPGVPYYGNDDSNIEVLRQYPDRLKTNWQYMAAIGLNYHFTDRARISLEPFYRQYIRSVYSPDSPYPARSPYAFGLRGGIYFHF